MNSRMLVFALVLAVGALGGYYLSAYMRKDVLVEDTERAREPNIAILSTKRVTEETDSYQIDMEYPQFGIRSVDERIADEVNGVVAQFKTDAAGDLVTSAKYELISIFDSVYIGSDVVGARLVISSYLGGAHPNSAIYGLNFFVDTGETLTLDDALKEIGMSLEAVAKIAQQKLSEKLGDAFFPKGAETSRDNYGTFIVSDDSITFVFQPYQVGPYAAGPQEVSFARK